MSLLSVYHPLWDQTRKAEDPSRCFEDDSLLLSTDFECGNGHKLRRIDDDFYELTIEAEPGHHMYSGKGYYFCFGVMNKSNAQRMVRIRIRPLWEPIWAQLSKHVVLKHRNEWSQLDPSHIHPAGEPAEAIEVELPLPGAVQGNELDNTLFVSNFHWWPYTEMVDYLGKLRPVGGLRVVEIGRSRQGRPLYAVEFGPDDAPCWVHAQTPQPSEMGSLACRALIDYLCSDEPQAVEARSRFKLCFIPMTNPDGTVHGYAVSNTQGRFPFFEAGGAATGEADVSPESVAVWQYLRHRRPSLFWEWHSNNWSRRPGHMLLRYRHDLLEDANRRRLWDDIEEGLLSLADTHHGNWTSRTEGAYQASMGFQTVTRLGAIACMIKQHDKFPLAASSRHAVACLQTALARWR
ncbi:MAG: putative carboxypeptidase Zn-dependent [Paenibacillus sp.]|jgi:hypothetical protein|nr:putative carboxypeptidase Zn-dependent [Paenibacillus sp.]